MRSNDLSDLLTGCLRTRGAESEALARLASWAGVELPGDYVELMKRSNGVEGFVSRDAFLFLWPVEEIVELNEAYCASEFVPGHLLVGSNGGELAYALNMRASPMSVVEVPFVGMSEKESRVAGASFREFIANLTSSG